MSAEKLETIGQSEQPATPRQEKPDGAQDLTEEALGTCVGGGGVTTSLYPYDTDTETMSLIRANPGPIKR